MKAYKVEMTVLKKNFFSLLPLCQMYHVQDYCLTQKVQKVLNADNKSQSNRNQAIRCNDFVLYFAENISQL